MGNIVLILIAIVLALLIIQLVLDVIGEYYRATTEIYLAKLIEKIELKEDEEKTEVL